MICRYQSLLPLNVWDENERLDELASLLIVCGLTALDPSRTAVSLTNNLSSILPPSEEEALKEVTVAPYRLQQQQREEGKTVRQLRRDRFAFSSPLFGTHWTSAEDPLEWVR